MTICFSETATLKIHERWTRRRLNAIGRRVEKVTGKKLPSGASLRVHAKRRGYGCTNGRASVPVWVLAKSQEELYGVYYVVHELLHVLGFSHGPRMQAAESQVVSTFGGQVWYGQTAKNYPTGIKKNGNFVCDEYGRKVSTWFYEI